jgi:hypothetical protein
MIEEEKAEAVKQSMIAASYTAWQMGEARMSFPLYLKKLGLADSEPELTAEQKEILTARGLDVAERINQAMKAGKTA